MTSAGRRTLWMSIAAILVGSLLVYVFFYHQESREGPPNISRPASDTGAKTAAEPPNIATATPKSEGIASDGTVAIPQRYQLPGVARVRAGSAANSKEWFASFSNVEQEKISAFDKRHFGVYSISSPLQIAWMAQNGYPMPEDILAAQDMSDQELRKLATSGNDKAGFLLRERDLDALKTTFETYAMTGKNPSDFWQSDPAASQMNQDEKLNTELMEKSNSPFRGYVQAEDSLLSSDPLDAASKVIGGLLLSESLGDFRAAQLAQSYSSTDPTITAIWMGAQVVAANSGKEMLRMKINGCNSTGVAPGLGIPNGFAPVE